MKTTVILTVGASIVAVIALVVLGRGSWAAGLVAGEILGFGAAAWVRAGVRQAFAGTPAGLRRNVLWLHSLTRVAVIGGVIAVLLRFTPISGIAILAGYALSQWPAAMWQIKSAPAAPRAAA